MITQDQMYNVKNRSSSIVVYKIPETNLRREFAPGEVKRVPFGELEKLTYQAGGRELLENFLQIIEEDVTTNLNVHREIEYDMSEAQIKDLLLKGSIDAFLDALDFAPIGVIDLIKTMSVSLPLTDLNKRRALKEKTGFDVDKALVHVEEEREAEKANKINTSEASPARRVKTETAAPAGRRTTPNYKVTKKAEEPAAVTEEGTVSEE